MTPTEWADKHLTVTYIGDMHWKKKRRIDSLTDPIQVMARDIVAASERHRATRKRDTA